MAGLDSIIEKIQKTSENTCDSILNDAKKKADDILAASAAESDAEAAKIAEETKCKAKEIIDSAVSGAELEGKKEILSAKIDIINDVIDTVSNTLKGLPDEEYFSSLYALAVRYARPEDGVLYLSAKDLARKPADFEKTLNTLIKEGSIKVSDEPRDIDGGFVLSYGGIEIDCTFDALIVESQDDIKDELARMLFG